MTERVNWLVRPFAQTDAPTVAGFFAENGEPGYTQTRIERRYVGTAWSKAYCVESANGQLAGFFGLLCTPYRDPNGQQHTALLFCDMVVAKAHRRKGVASAAIQWLHAQGQPQLNVGMNTGMYSSLRANSYPALRQLHLVYRYRLPKAIRSKATALQPVEIDALSVNSPIPFHLGAESNYLRFRYADVPHVRAFQGVWGTAVVQVLPTQVLLLDLFGPQKRVYVPTTLQVADALLVQFPQARRVVWLANRRWLGLHRWLLAGAVAKPQAEWFTAVHAPDALLAGPLSFGLPDFVSPYPPTIR